jgi:hypothetical protein
MANLYKLIPVGKGLKLYRVERVSDNLHTGIVVSGCPYTNGKEKPWQVRWTDILSNRHEDNFRTKREAVEYLEGRRQEEVFGGAQ